MVSVQSVGMTDVTGCRCSEPIEQAGYWLLNYHVFGKRDMNIIHIGALPNKGCISMLRHYPYRVLEILKKDIRKRAKPQAFH